MYSWYNQPQFPQYPQFPQQPLSPQQLYPPYPQFPSVPFAGPFPMEARSGSELERLNQLLEAQIAVNYEILSLVRQQIQQQRPELEGEGYEFHHPALQNIEEA